jgi:hypothetical protein
VASAKWSVANTPCDGSGSYYVSWLVNAIDWADTIGAASTNNSNGFGSQSSITSKYQETRNNGVVHFASSGNDGTSTIGYPGSLSTVNAVGAINRNGNRASFSTYGSDLAYVAPGQSIYTTDRTGGDGYGGSDYDWVDGTSFSSPFAAALAGLVRSQDDTLTVDEVETILETTCTDRGTAGWDTQYGFGIVNAEAALIAAGAGGGGYCDAGSDDTSDEYIANVTVGTIDNDSGRASYSNFTAISTTMAVGVGYAFTVTNGETFSGDQCGVWVDWNQDEDFNDADETITVDNTPGQDPYVGTITPPAGALLGDTRMRIRVMYTGTVSPCGNASYGEVEDYTVNVTGEVQGACCLPTGNCAYGTPALCATFGGIYMGDGVECIDVTCPFGACCYSDGSCQDQFETDCLSAGGTYQGDGTDCGTTTCPMPQGACCLISGSCAYGTESVCNAAGGIYQGDGVQCSQVTCVPRGACCWADQTCSDGLSESDCVGGGGTYMGDVTYCSNVTCPDAEGACCWPDGSCTMETEANCASVEGTYQGDGIDCGSVECPQPNDCPWDFDESLSVGIGDLNALLSNWGAPCPGAGCSFDYDESGSVGLGDLNAMLSNWGPCP